MSNPLRYQVTSSKEGDGVLVVDSQTGTLQHPSCGQDLAAYYNYLLGRGRIDESQKLLADCMLGNKPITSMLLQTTRPHQ